MNLKENDHEIEAAFGRLDFIFFISNASEVRANTPKPNPKPKYKPKPKPRPKPKPNC